MKNIFLGFITAGILVISCKKDEKPTYIKDAGTQQPATAVNNAPQTSLLNQAGIQTAAPNSQSVATAPGMNPPHGQPGHKCEIPVGQPLNGAGGTVQTANPSTQNITVNGNNQPVQIDPNAVSPGKIMIDQNGKQVKTAPGMNPPHGQPGHRCDIPVGQALNSKPAPASQPSAQTNHIQAPQPAPAPQAVANNTGPKPKLNPAHGEPWHDCAKKVGDAL